MDIWNSKRIQYIRKCILENNLKEVCNLKYCPYAIKKQKIKLKEIKTHDEHMNKIIRQIRLGKTNLDTAPYTFELSNSGACNLNCIMCKSNKKYIRKDKYLDRYIFSKLLPEILPEVSELILSGFGDPFFNKYSRRFLQTSNAESYPSLKINLITNGLLFTRKLWESIKHNNFNWINISVDAATKSTYEYVRRNGRWSVLQKNLKLISSLRKRQYFNAFIISFIVMKSNYTEIKEFARLGLKLGCDTVLYQKIYGNENLRENINLSKNTKIMVEIANILKDPIFRQKRMNTTLIDDYCKLSNKKSNRKTTLYTKVVELVCYYPLALIHTIGNRFSFLYIFIFRVYQLLKTIKYLQKLIK